MQKFLVNKTEYLKHFYGKNCLFIDIFVILIFWMTLFLLGYPDPNVDDLFFIGAGINLADGGDFVNPLLSSWNEVFSSGKYYYHFPYYSYIVAFWIKIFGLNAKSLCLFQVFNSFVFSINCLLILKFMQFKKHIYPLIIILFALWINSIGLRPDCIGMALLSLGLLLLTKNKKIFSFFGFFFIIASFLSSTLVLFVYGISFSIGILTINYIQLKYSQESIIYDLKIKFVLLICAVLVNANIFLVLIQFNFNYWLRDFLHHASLRRTPTLESFSHFFQQLIFAWNPLILIPSYIIFIILLFSYLLLSKSKKISHVIFLLSLVSAITLNVIVYSNATSFITFFVLVGILVVSPELLLKFHFKKIIFVFCLAVVIGSQSLKIIYLTQRYYPKPAYFENIKIKVDKMAKPEKYVIDSVAARFIFDYNLPVNSISFDFIGVNRYPLKTDKKDNDIWIVSRPALGQIKELKIDYPRIKFLHREFNSLPKEPFDIVIMN